MRPRWLVALVFAGCVEALPADDRRDAGTGYLRLLRPRTGATVFARRPRLRWFRSDVTIDARVELCADRPCTRVLQTVDARGGDTQVPAALPTGVVFWRVRPRRGATVAPWGSPTGWFVVARGARDDGRTDSIDVRPRLQIDVDGDGLADVVLPDGTIFRSAGASFERSPYGRLTNANGEGAVMAGDLNDDGYLDVAVADPGGRPGGVVHLYNGPLPRGVVAPTRQLTGPDGVGWQLSRIDNLVDAPAGDVNGDGYDDLLITSTRVGASSRVHLFLGGRAGVAYEPAQTFDAPVPQQTGFTACAVADLDGDGFDEAMFGSPTVGTVPLPTFDALAVFVHRGSPSGIETPATWTLRAGFPTGTGGAGALADVDGVGEATAVLGQGNPRGGGCIGLFRSPLGADVDAASESVGCEEAGVAIGGPFEAGDVDGDGRADIVASVVRPGGPLTLDVRIYRAPTLAGGPWQRSTLAAAPGGPTGVRRFGLGDVDGDGVMDGITSVQTTGGAAAFVHRGGVDGLAAAGARVGP